MFAAAHGDPEFPPEMQSVRSLFLRARIEREKGEVSDRTAETMHALRAHCRGFRAGVAAASDAEGRAFVTEARAIAVLRALGATAADAARVLDVAREDASAILGADADSYDVRCVAALLVIELIRARIGRVT